ncbi:MAG: ABC transporter substrate-binding protein [Acidimicrobiales bacterium]
MRREHDDRRGRRRPRARPAPALVLAGLVLGAALATGWSTAAGAAGATPGITAHSVTVGQVDTLSGPVPGLFEGAKDGTEAYFAYINSKGGVNGRKLILQTDDDQFSAANYAADTAQLVKSDFALVGGFSLFDAAGVSAINQAKIPDVTYSLSAQRETDPYNYSPNPTPPGGSELGPYEYYKSHYGDAYQHVGTLVGNVPSAIAGADAAEAAMKSLGYKFAYSRIVNPIESNYIPDVLKMRSAGVKMVFISSLSVGQVAALAQDMAQEGFKPALFTTSGVAYDSSFIPDAGAAANGTYSTTNDALYLGQDAKVVPAVGLFDHWMKKVDPKAHLDLFGVNGWAAAEMFVQALKGAGKNPTRASLFAQLNKITSFDAGGLLATDDPAQKLPGHCWLLVRVHNGNWQRTGPDPKSGFVCKPAGYHPTLRPYQRPAGA